MKKKWIFYFIGGLLGPAGYAQGIAPSIFNASGGTAVAGGYTHEWSVGEMVLVQTASSGPLTVTQGVLQPIYADHAAITEQTAGLQQHLVMYPNPTSGNIFLQPDLSAGSKLEVRLLDLTGKVLTQREIWLAGGKEMQTFDLNTYASGMYILQVQWQQGAQQQNAVYKIQKQ